MKKVSYMKYIIVVVLLLVCVVGFMLWKNMSEPLYSPGDIQKGKNMSSSLKPPTQPNEDSFWLVEKDIKLKYFTKGEGRNVLVIHGGPGIPYVEAWPGLDRLTKDYKFNYYDQRGAGESTRPINTFNSKNYYENMLMLESTLGLTAQVADIERIRQILGEEKLIIIGHSFGSVLASLYAAEFPDNVESLVLVTPAPLLKMPNKLAGLFDSIEKHLPDEMKEDYQEFYSGYFDFKNVFSKTEEELIAQNIELGEYFASSLEGSDVAFPEFGKPGGWMVQAMYLSMGKKHDYIKSFKGIDIPALIIHADNDIVQVEEASRSYLEVFPYAKFEIIKGAGHMAFYDKQDEFADIVSDFLESNKIECN